MSRLLTLGVLSQAGDLAKKLADAYCAYMVAVGAEVDYQTIYNIYKDEYLTDPDKDKLAVWFDGRAGKKKYLQTGYYSTTYSLIYPYTAASSGSLTWYVQDGKYYRSGASTPQINYNVYSLLYQDIKNLKTVTKFDWLPSIFTGNQPVTFYFGQDNIPTLSVSHYLRYYGTVGNVSPRSYLTHYELTNPSTLLHTGTPNDLIGVINTQEINYVDYIHRNTFDGEVRQAAINPVNTHKRITPTTLSYMYIYPQLPKYWEKVYKM